jgi:hypothetical protein
MRQQGGSSETKAKRFMPDGMSHNPTGNRRWFLPNGRSHPGFTSVGLSERVPHILATIVHYVREEALGRRLSSPHVNG